jgi:hypothetical protein
MKLSQKRNWTVELALRFVRDRYELGRMPDGQPRFSTVRGFCDYMQKKPKNGGMKGEDEVLMESSSYTT